ncbi:MAG: 6-phosphogluconolactonase [Hyphomicrobiales bacterium]|nr:6-phosphogluconolactonase [Hyphomicrobiales bacterium]
MRLFICENAEALACDAAARITQIAEAAMAERGFASIAFSGGHTPNAMFRALAKRPLDWSKVHVLQTDERLVAANDPDRNFLQLRTGLLDHVPIPSANIHPMPVEDDDPLEAAARYADLIERLTGPTFDIDIIHLGLGADGHTASLVPGDAVIENNERNVAITAPYRGHRRMTLTFPALDAAGERLFLVSGADKAEALARLVAADPSIPAGRVVRAGAIIVADRAAARLLGETKGARYVAGG